LTSATLGSTGVPAGQPTFRERLARDPEVGARLSAQDLDHAFDLKHHTRYSDAIIERALRDRDH
jgi:adenylosuccinate lyase